MELHALMQLLVASTDRRPPYGPSYHSCGRSHLNDPAYRPVGFFLSGFFWFFLEASFWLLELVCSTAALEAPVELPLPVEVDGWSAAR